MAGKLYLVATPIGNLGDISPRAEKTLSEADFIAAEDTRVTLRLLNHLNIKKSLVSYYEHNKGESGPRIIERILAGENCALVTDAGMPAISDPGEDIVRLAAAEGIETVVIPGPSAVVCALALSALPTVRFTFEGFLPAARGERVDRLAELAGEKRTMVFYEAPHKLRGTLKDMLDCFGADRKISLARELTKMHEETLRMTIGEAVGYYEKNDPQGEFVLVIEGAAEKTGPEISMDEAVELVLKYRDEGLPLKAAAKKCAAETGYSKNALYGAAIARDM